MELSLPHSSSLGISALNSHCKSTSSCKLNGIGKLNCNLPLKLSKNVVPFGLYNPASCSNHHVSTNRNSIRACSQVGAANSSHSDPTLNKIPTLKDACWRFLRPHTLYGTALASFALYARAFIDSSNFINWSLLLKASSGLIALICANSYIVGINQIYDIGIDKVNKPYLPIAGGDLSVQSAWLLVILFAVGGLVIVKYSNSGPFITCLYSLSLFMGTIYSVPPFRIKRFPVAAFLMIATVRGFLSILGCIMPQELPLAFHFSGGRFEISTLATKLGVRNIAFLGSGILLVNYIAAVLVPIYMPQAFRRNLMIPAHVFLALCLVFQAWVLEKANYSKEAISGFYRFIWNLFYAEYAIFPFV